MASKRRDLTIHQIERNLLQALDLAQQFSHGKGLQT